MLGVTTQPSTRRVFSLNQARELLPEVKALTAAAVRRVEALASRLQQVQETDATYGQLESSIEEAVTEWTRALHAMGLETKGLWLVDFDNGEGYYCWCYPEDSVAHFHEYDGGFAGRMKIV